MIYKFSYTYKNQLIREVYTNAKWASNKFNFLIALNIPFRIITIAADRGGTNGY